MKISYFPGCTLKTTARNFEDSALASLKVLGVDLVELSRWNCCGTVYSLASDDLMHHLAPVRDLIRVKEEGASRVVTLCSMCYNTLKQANELVKADSEKLDKINQFMYREEVDYDGSVEVTHLIEILRDEVGWEALKKKVTRPLEGIRLAPYYGCLLVRPTAVALDDPEQPHLLEELLEALGAEVIDYPYKTECCGSYHTITNVGLVMERTYTILTSASQHGAEAVVVSCPLCDFNLDSRQKNVQDKFSSFERIPVFYFTQLLSVALGLDVETCHFDLHFVDPRPLLEDRIPVSGKSP